MNPTRTPAVGLLVMAYGSAGSLDELPAFYTHIRRGRPPSDEQLTTLAARYAAIGGVSPLAGHTRDQAAVLSAAFADEIGRREPGTTTRSTVGYKHAAPFIEDAVAELTGEGAEKIIGVVLAPHFSRASVGDYHSRALAAAATSGATYVAVDRWWDLDEVVDFHAARLTARLAESPAAHIVFTAHSLPLRVLDGDPYPSELTAAARAISDRAGLPRWGAWGVAWQSAGATPEPWAGPDLLTVIRDLSATGRSDHLVVVPHGFTSEHLEVLYDIDIEARALADELGLSLTRTDVIGADPTVMAAVARRAVDIVAASTPEVAS